VDSQCDKLVTVVGYQCITMAHLYTAWWAWGTASCGSVSGSGELFYLWDIKMNKRIVYNNNNNNNNIMS